MSKKFKTNKYKSNRNVVYSNQGMVSTTEPKASQAGLDILKKGGNAIDAAIAAATSLAVLEPTSNGIGGDAFALVWYEGKLYGLNGSGPAAKNISIDKLKERGFDKVPTYGMIPVNVPGAPAVWSEMVSRFGKLDLKTVMESAIHYADKGYPVSPTVAKCWSIAFERLNRDLDKEKHKELFKVFTKDGRTPEVGELWKSEEMAKSLEKIAESNSESFYRGEIARKIIECSEEMGGYLSYEDLASYKPEWVEPIKVNYKGYDIWELPPNTHGIVVLMALKIFEKLEIENDSDYYHKMIESMKLAYNDGLEYITDYNHLCEDFKKLLSEDYFKERADLISEKALEPSVTALDNGGTVYLSTADKDGNMVSYIQSNFMDFGSGVVVPGTGINLHNRGITFSLDPKKHNSLKGGKKTYHTIIPGFITKDGEAIGPFGVMGKYMQPQGHFQVVSNLIDLGLNPQEALDKYRWQWIDEKNIWVEKDFPKDIVKELREKGHNIKVCEDSDSFGRGQVILKSKDKVLAGGTEKRADGNIAVY